MEVLSVGLSGQTSLYKKSFKLITVERHMGGGGISSGSVLAETIGETRVNDRE